MQDFVDSNLLTPSLTLVHLWLYDLAEALSTLCWKNLKRLFSLWKCNKVMAGFWSVDIWPNDEIWWKQNWLLFVVWWWSGIIVVEFSNKIRSAKLQNWSTLKHTASVCKFIRFEQHFQKVLFSADNYLWGLRWTEGLTVRIRLHFQIYLA